VNGEYWIDNGDYLVFVEPLESPPGYAAVRGVNWFCVVLRKLNNFIGSTLTEKHFEVPETT
jgi:hypothetical protein